MLRAISYILLTLSQTGITTRSV